ncbi:Uncharacterised protein [Bacteroides pyogenes]|nr:Uncharacterised protein [Bacteroides pyogenes]
MLFFIYFGVNVCSLFRYVVLQFKKSSRILSLLGNSLVL